MSGLFAKEAKGHKQKHSNHITIAIGFEPIMFANISERAKAGKRSFREEVRRLVEFALAKGA